KNHWLYKCLCYDSTIIANDGGAYDLRVQSNTSSSYRLIVVSSSCRSNFSCLASSLRNLEAKRKRRHKFLGLRFTTGGLSRISSMASMTLGEDAPSLNACRERK